MKLTVSVPWKCVNTEVAGSNWALCIDVCVRAV